MLYATTGGPTLQPILLYACPNKSVVFSCSDNQVSVLEWSVKPYTTEDDELSYTPSQIIDNPGPLTKNSTDNTFSSNILHFSRVDGRFANMTVALTIKSFGVGNGTLIMCTTIKGINRSDVNSTIYFASNNIMFSLSTLNLPLFSVHNIGAPYSKEVNITCHIKEKHFTAVLELGDMFYGGGVPIDHYIIQVEDGTQLETPGSTYSFDIMYNTSLPVNISAHNCAGYSDPFTLEIHYEGESVSR